MATLVLERAVRSSHSSNSYIAMCICLTIFWQVLLSCPCFCCATHCRIKLLAEPALEYWPCIGVLGNFCDRSDLPLICLNTFVFKPPLLQCTFGPNVFPGSSSSLGNNAQVLTFAALLLASGTLAQLGLEMPSLPILIILSVLAVGATGYGTVNTLVRLRSKDMSGKEMDR